MGNTFPLSNIPLIFTQYRTKILEETGRDWYHLSNDPNPEPAVSSSESNATLADSSSDSIPDIETGSEIEATPITVQETIAETIPDLTIAAYEHPDPWETPPIDLAEEANNPLPTIASPITAAQAAPIQTSETPLTDKRENIPDLESQADQSSSNHLNTDGSTVEPSDESKATRNKVNLFPFENEAIDGSYDLTEFANGEIEVPPVAVRDTKTASFEKLNTPEMPPENISDTEESSEEASVTNKGKKKKKKTAASSAEIAKYRLRNIV